MTNTYTSANTSTKHSNAGRQGFSKMGWRKFAGNPLLERLASPHGVCQLLLFARVRNLQRRPLLRPAPLPGLAGRTRHHCCWRCCDLACSIDWPSGQLSIR